MKKIEKPFIEKKKICCWSSLLCIAGCTELKTGQNTRKLECIIIINVVLKKRQYGLMHIAGHEMRDSMLCVVCSWCLLNQHAILHPRLCPEWSRRWVTPPPQFLHQRRGTVQRHFLGRLHLPLSYIFKASLGGCHLLSNHLGPSPDR